MWSADYVQIPVEGRKLNPSLAVTQAPTAEPSTTASPERPPSPLLPKETMAEKIVRKLSAVDTDDVDSFRSQHTSANVLIKCGSDSSLSEDDGASHFFKYILEFRGTEMVGNSDSVQGLILRDSFKGGRRSWV